MVKKHWLLSLRIMCIITGLAGLLYLFFIPQERVAYFIGLAVVYLYAFLAYRYGYKNGGTKVLSIFGALNLYGLSQHFIRIFGVMREGAPLQDVAISLPFFLLGLYHLVFTYMLIDLNKKARLARSES